MQKLCTLLVTILSFQMSYGQIDSLALPRQLDTVSTRVGGIQSAIKNRIDSISNPISRRLKPTLPADSISSINRQLDSIHSNLSARVDSLTRSYSSELTKLKSAALAYQTKMDSLTSLKAPSDKYKARLDSVSRRFADVQQDLQRKLETIKSNATETIKSIKYPPELEDRVSALTKTVGDLDLNTIESKLPGNLGIDDLKSLKNSLSISGFASVPDVSTPDIPKLDGLSKDLSIPDLKTDVSDIKGVEKLGAINGQSQALQNKVSESAKDLSPGSIDKLVESKATELKEVKALSEAPNALPIKVAMSEKEMKAKLKEQVQKVAVDHFAGKEQQLKAAMEKISKYKQRYSSVKNIADLPKKPKNQIKEKPFIERILPGLGLQLQKKGDDLLVDFNPYVGYRFTTRITAGVGWNERVPYNTELNSYNPDARVYGPRVFGEFKLGKGFSPRLELEEMNTVVPPLTQTTPVDPNNREWVFGVFVGMKKEYKIFKQVKGTASVMTRLFNPEHKSPYADVLNVRFGFEFPMKKNHKVKT